MNTDLKKSRKIEEIINSTTHGIGLLGAIAFTVILVVKAALYGDAWNIVTYSIFGAGMIVLYLASTLYHSARNLRKKSKLNVFDHSAIYVLIAATYTPITLVGLHSAFGWVIFGIIWAMALAGIIFKVWFYTRRLRLLSTLLYIGMGLTILIAIVPIIQQFPSISIWFLFIGGLSFITGTIFYQNKRIPYGHGLFHIFVLGGSICHFFSIFYLI